MGKNYGRKRKYKSNIFWTALKSSVIVFCLLMVLLIGVVIIGYKEPDYKEESDGELQIVYLNLPSMEKEEDEIVKEDNETDFVNEPEVTETTEAVVAEADSVVTGPFSIELKWAKDSEDGYIVKYRQLSTNNDKHGKANREDKSMSMSEICSAFVEGFDDSGIEDANHGWHSIKTERAACDITGLLPDKDYEIHIIRQNDTEYKSKFTVHTDSYGYGDPFKSIDAFIRVSERDQNTGKIINLGNALSVKMSSVNGCNNVVVKPVKNLTAYSDVSCQVSNCTVMKGNELKIMVDTDGNYCYYSQNGEYLVRVKDDAGNQGWVNARFLMVDVAGMFSPEDSKYGIQINRTNATASIFTAGGSGKSVDVTSEENSRYDCLADGTIGTFLNSSGYNVINNVTGQKLANYGNSTQMPVIWDLAIELIQCQKTSLENGYTLLMYEGYRPYSASQQVSGNLSGQGILSNSVYNTNLAQGFLTDKTYDYSYYISKASRHNKGTATDLTLVEFVSNTELGKEVEMQTKMHTLDFRCNMLFNNWQADLLSDIMMGHGSNLECLSVRSEWWHFQMNNKRTDIYPYIGEYEYYDIVF